MRALTTIATFGLIAACGILPARAAEVTVHYQGFVQSSSGTMSTASPFYDITATYDGAVADSNSGPNIGTYIQNGTITMTSGSLVVSLPLTEIDVNWPYSGITFYSSPYYAMQIKFILFTGDIPGGALPDPLPHVDPGGLSSGTDMIVWDFTRTASLNGVLVGGGASLVEPVPEPGTLVLLALPMLAIALRAKTARKPPCAA